MPPCPTRGSAHILTQVSASFSVSKCGRRQTCQPVTRNLWKPARIAAMTWMAIAARQATKRNIRAFASINNDGGCHCGEKVECCCCRSRRYSGKAVEMRRLLLNGSRHSRQLSAPRPPVCYNNNFRFEKPHYYWSIFIGL